MIRKKEEKKMSFPKKITLTVCPHDEQGKYQPESCTTVEVPVFQATPKGTSIEPVQQPGPQGGRNMAVTACPGGGYVASLSMSGGTYRMGCVNNSGQEVASATFASTEPFRALAFIPQ